MWRRWVSVLYCVGTKHINAKDNEFWKRLFNATVYMKFRVCFTLAKYENDMLSLCETTNVFIDAFLLFQNPFLSVRII